ncbi:response regulator [Patescibacteria group bacterium]|nr:response regulator [Patescibacteria group bacterium]
MDNDASQITPGDTVRPADSQPTKKVLCIEDERFIGELYIRALSKAGYDVTLEVDGARGLTLAQSDAYDIILLDLMLPNVTGIEILRTLRDPNKTPHLKAKIIITTNLEQREDVRQDIEKQADGYIVKAEMTPRELVDFLNNIR